MSQQQSLRERVKAYLREKKYEKGCDYIRASHVKDGTGIDQRIGWLLIEFAEEGYLDLYDEKDNGNLYRITIDEEP